MLASPTVLTMLRTNRLILRRSLDTGSADAELASLGVLYVSRLERLVREGRRDGEASVAIASRLVRTLTQTPVLEEDRAVPREAPAAPPEIRREDCVVREPGEPWRRPEDRP
jgi:hypothetical protein